MNSSYSKLNELKQLNKDKHQIKKSNQPVSYQIQKSKSQVTVKKDLKSIISNLKSEIIHISLDKTGKNQNKPSKAPKETDNSFNGKRPSSSSHHHIMTDINHSPSPLKKDINGSYYNELINLYNKLKLEYESFQKPKGNHLTNITSNGSKPSLSIRDKPSYHDNIPSVSLTDSNTKRIPRSIPKNGEMIKKAFESKRDLKEKHKKKKNATKDNEVILKEYKNEIIKLKEDNKALNSKCNEFIEKIMLLIKEKKEQETVISSKNDIIEKQNKVIETLTTQNSIQISNVQSNEKLTEEII